ncbi:ATP-binding protein [Kribbella sp. NPDC003505]|uniref:sensor histidine kinase n=1 Tax=Kribbella sp. NPDC003505 TaxID=3154448 RepID=UPI0033A66F21
MPDLRLSTALRAALVAGLVAAVLAVGFAFWIHHQIFTSRYHDLERQADSDRQQLIANMYGYRTVQPVAGSLSPLDAVFEVVDDTGKVLESSPAIRAFGPVPVAPGPNRYDLKDSSFVTVRALGPDARCAGAPRQGDCAIATRMAGRRVWVNREAVSVRGVTLKGDPNRVAVVSVFVVPFEAEDAAAEVDRVLQRTLPLAVLLIMVGAYVGTRLALRPIERMRSRAAAISQRNLHERLPIPPTGDAVARLAATLNDTLARLEAAAEQQRGFVADAAHELRSPIATLRTTLEVAGAHPERADWPRVNRVAVEEVQRLQQLADDLLLMARLDADATTTVQPVDLAELARRQLARRIDDGPGLHFESARSAMVESDPRQLDRLLRNLLDNAVRHARSSVTVRIEQRAEHVVLHIEDDGPGIPAADRERVFERFTRLDEARTRDAGGAGLGLAIAREIAHRHHGTLTASAPESGGSRFTLSMVAG